MKKSLVKLAALSSAAFVLAGGLNASALEAEVIGVENKNAALEEAKIVYGAPAVDGKVDYRQSQIDSNVYYLSVEDGVFPTAPELQEAKRNAIAEARAAGKGDFFIKQILRANTVEGVQALVAELTKPVEPEAPALTPLTPAEELHITEIPFNTEKEAREAAEDHLKKDEVNNSYDIYHNLIDDKYYVTLSTEEPVPAEPTPETPVKKGYKTREEAEAAAEEALKNDKINKSYKVSQGADDLWYYVLSPVEAEEVKPEDPKPEDPKPEDPKPEDPKPETPEKDLDTVKKEALARLDLLKALTKAEVEHFTKAILNAESANEVAAIIKEAEDVNFSVNLEAETPAKEVKPEESKEGSKKEEKKEDKKEKLPETGEVSSFAIFGGAALSVLAGLGLVASKKEEN